MRTRAQYPDLREKQTYITKVIRTEEENFGRTIDGGMKIFSDLLGRAQAEAGETVSPAPTPSSCTIPIGFPIDLTMEMAADEGLSVDENAFQKLMQEQQERAREARKALGDLGWAGVEFGKDVPATEFVGYDHSECDAKIVAIVADERAARKSVAAGAEAVVVLDQYPLLRRDGRSGGRPRHHHRRRRACSPWRTYRRTRAASSCTIGRSGTGCAPCGRHRSRRHVDMERRKAIHACSQRHPPAGCGAEEGAGRPRPSGRLSGGAGSPALRLHPLRGHHPGGAAAGGGAGERCHSGGLSRR